MPHLAAAKASISKKDFATAKSELEECAKSVPASFSERCSDLAAVVECKRQEAVFLSAPERETLDLVTWEAIRAAAESSESGSEAHRCYQAVLKRHAPTVRRWNREFEAAKRTERRQEWKRSIGRCKEIQSWWRRKIVPLQRKIQRLRSQGRYDDAQEWEALAIEQIRRKEADFNRALDRVRRVVEEMQEDGADESEIRRHIEEADRFCTPAG